MREESCTGKLSLMGHGCLEGVIQHVKRFGMDFVEVLVPNYEFISSYLNEKTNEVETYKKSNGLKSAGLYSYASIYSIEIYPVKFDKSVIELSCEDLPF